MSKGKGKKTEFKFTVNAESTLIEAVIRNYLTVNRFVQQPQGGVNYYYIKESDRSFEYDINGNQVTILAYMGKYNKPKALEGFVAAVPKQVYRNELQPLFEELKKLEYGNNGEATTNSGGSFVPLNDSLNAFTEENNKKKETQVIIGFVISIIGLVLSCFGFMYGAILLLLEFSFAIQGLHTKKKGLAIATIVIASISVLIVIAEVILTAMLA